MGVFESKLNHLQNSEKGMHATYNDTLNVLLISKLQVYSLKDKNLCGKLI
jgi:hypothetical protein